MLVFPRPHYLYDRLIPLCNVLGYGLSTVKTSKRVSIPAPISENTEMEHWIQCLDEVPVALTTYSSFMCQSWIAVKTADRGMTYEVMS